MLHLNLIQVKTPEEAGRAAADLFEDLIRAKPACVLGLATGSTPLPLYRELIAREKAGKIVMIITGADKAEILHKVFYGPVKPEVPGSILQFHPDVTVICDEAAASRLSV